MTSTETQQVEADRAGCLQDAQDKADALFGEIAKTLIRPGVTEKQLSDEIHALGQKRYNPYAANPPDRMIEEDDILFVDLGPVFEAWEADFGRTYVLGDDPAKKQLRDSLEPAWRETKERFDADPDMTGEQLYTIAKEKAKERGYEFGGLHSGHLVGDFPHERIANDKITHYITDGNKDKMRSVGRDGHQRHWILEMHLVDGDRKIGAFMEQLLTVG